MSSLRRAGRYLGSLLANLYFWVGLAGLALLAFGAYLLFNDVLMPQYTRYGVAVTVPEVTSVPVEQAQGRLEERELRVETLRRSFNPEVERGAVIEQSPKGGRSVKPGRRVYLTVNSGSEQKVSVPRVKGGSVREAKNRLRAAGLAVGTIAEDSLPSKYPETITRQQPAAGDSLRPGAAVDLWYSPGLADTYATVPDVTGMTVEEARQALLDRRIRSVALQSSEGEDANARPAPGGEQTDLSGRTVVRQSREPDTRVRQGFEVRLFVEE
ncbi:MAG: penicillin-binding protein [Bacteroidetes bacterium QS_9_68_14]|nr:MAG: penicillin-binding protein [Bacteroidetes bacterium QS_9_68_14]